jgi:peptidoglycan/LPS O-acetylase OafA/YrhL
MKEIRLHQLDGLRGIFAIMIVLHHFDVPPLFTTNAIIRQSAIFTDFFFVLSGFVISYTYFDRIQDSESFIDYIKKRFARLFPLLVYTVCVFLFFKIGFSYFYPAILEHPQAGKELGLLTIDSLTFMNSTPIFGSEMGMNFPSWSISAEMICYICFGLIIVFVRSARGFLFLMVMLLAAAFLYSQRYYMMEGSFGFVRALLCFNMGVFVYLLFKKFHSIRIWKIWEYILPLVLVALFYIKWELPKDKKEMFTLAVVPLFFGAFVFVYAMSKGLIVRLLTATPFQFIGKISYSIYLNHAIIIILVTKLIFDIFKVPRTEVAMTMTLLLTLSVVIIYSYFTYGYVEQYRHKFYKKTKQKEELQQAINRPIG